MTLNDILAMERLTRYCLNEHKAEAAFYSQDIAKMQEAAAKEKIPGLNSVYIAMCAKWRDSARAKAEREASELVYWEAQAERKLEEMYRELQAE